MGMYDSLKINISMLPLSDSDKAAIGDNIDWQTKDFDCLLYTLEIRDDDMLYILRSDLVWDENEESALYEITGKKGALVQKNERWENIPFHGHMRFYGMSRGVWYEFNAKFTDGKLVNITRID